MSLVTRIIVDRNEHIPGNGIPGEYAAGGHHGERVASRHHGERKQASLDLDLPKVCRREPCGFASTCERDVRA